MLDKTGRIAHLIRRASELSVMDWLYLATAVKELLIARVWHAVSPAGRILRKLEKGGEGPQQRTARDIDVERVSWALAAAAARVPWRSDCLLTAMAADRWLRRHGLTPTFYLGVARPAGDRFEAHAWLRCGDVIVTGGTAVDYTPLMPSTSI